MNKKPSFQAQQGLLLSQRNNFSDMILVLISRLFDVSVSKPWRLDACFPLSSNNAMYVIVPSGDLIQ